MLPPLQLPRFSWRLAGCLAAALLAAASGGTAAVALEWRSAAGPVPSVVAEPRQSAGGVARATGIRWADRPTSQSATLFEQRAAAAAASLPQSPRSPVTRIFADPQFAAAGHWDEVERSVVVAARPRDQVEGAPDPFDMATSIAQGFDPFEGPTEEGPPAVAELVPEAADALGSPEAFGDVAAEALGLGGDHAPGAPADDFGGDDFGNDYGSEPSDDALGGDAAEEFGAVPNDYDELGRGEVADEMADELADGATDEGSLYDESQEAVERELMRREQEGIEGEIVDENPFERQPEEPSQQSDQQSPPYDYEDEIDEDYQLPDYLREEDEEAPLQLSPEQERRRREQIERERIESAESCRELLDAARGDRIEGISLNIRIEGDPGEDYPFECPLGDEMFSGRSWEQITYLWKASGLCHKPLYFEQVQLERYGHSWGPYVQPIMSGVHFFASVPILPYKMGIRTPQECVYTLGYYRPGSCAPYMIDAFPFTLRAAMFQGGVSTALPFIFP